jgi:hypothetical protein
MMPNSIHCFFAMFFIECFYSIITDIYYSKFTFLN